MYEFLKKQNKTNSDTGESTGKTYGSKEYGLFWLDLIEFITAIHK